MGRRRCATRTTVVLPADLVATALELSPARTKPELLIVALEECVKQLRRQQSLQMPGTGFLNITHEDLGQMRSDG